MALTCLCVLIAVTALPDHRIRRWIDVNGQLLAQMHPGYMSFDIFSYYQKEAPHLQSRSLEDIIDGDRIIVA